MASAVPLMPEAGPNIERLGHDGAEWLRAEAALLRHDLATSAQRLLGAAGLCLLAQALLLVGLLQASQAAIIGLTLVTGSTMGATVTVALGAFALAALAAVIGIYFIRAGLLSGRLTGRLSAAWTMVTRNTR